MLGKTIGHYRIVSRLGQGGMGEVYLADDLRLDRKVALKFLPPALWGNPVAQERLLREARAASQLDHPNIVTVHGIEEFEGRPFIAMAYVRGATLGAHCAAAPRSIDDLLDLAIQMADGLAHAHERGVIHRDLKPSNILVDETGRVRILDFGIASQRGASSLTQTGTTLGTLAYAPPEIAQGHAAEPRSDLYSLGVVLYEMVSGRLPYDAEHEAGLLYAILHAAPRPLAGRDEPVPATLQRLVLRCLEKDPARRFADARELEAELRRVREALAAGPPAFAEAPAIAVLPFSNMSADPENEYFSDGLSEELMNVLAKNPGLRVTGRTSSFAFKGRHEDLREIGSKLGVGVLLEGSVRKAGNRVRITAQLVKAADGFHLWSETYDRVLDDIFAVQDDIARSVAESMDVTLLGRPSAPVQASGESYDLILRALRQVNEQTGPALEKAVELYREALARAPNDARAWAGLARAHAVQAGSGFVDVEAASRSALEAGERALALDGSLAEAHAVLAWIRLSHEYRFTDAIEGFRRAHALAPRDGSILVSLAHAEAILGDLDAAVRMSEQAVELDPLSGMTRYFRARVLILARRYDAALVELRRVLELNPEAVGTRARMGFCLGRLGRPADGLVEAAREPLAGYRLWATAELQHQLGDMAASDRALQDLLAQGDGWAIQVASVHGCRGDADATFEWLERAYIARDAGLPMLRHLPQFDSLHADPRWSRLVDRLGLGAGAHVPGGG